ncbi:MAG: hypothetical protein AAGC57_01750 [Pseudomonadota bacterium]
MISIPGVLAATPLLNGSSHPLPADQSHSLQFPQGNTGADSARFSYVTGSGITETLFASTGALIAVVEVPWERYGQQQDESHFILGNDWRDVPLGGGMSLAAMGPREDSSQRQIVFRVSNDSLQSRKGTVSLTGMPRRLVICVSSDGANLAMRVYADGVLAGSEAWDGGLTGFSGLALDGDVLLIGCTGSGSSLAGTPFGSGATRGFDGSVGFVGYHAGAVADAALESISFGQRPEVALPVAANWLIGREFEDYTAPTVPAASWATADTRGDWVATETRAFAPGGDVTVARDGSGNWLGLDPLLDGQVWGCAPGQSSVSVPLSGTGSGLSGGVEARLIYLDGTVASDWQTVAGASLGAGPWSGTVTWPLSTEGWGYVEVRDTATGALDQRSRAQVGVGWVIACVGQSNIEFPVKNTVGGFGPSDPGNLSIAFRFRSQNTVSGLAPGSGSLVVDRVTVDSPRTNGTSAMADELKRYGNTPVMLIDMMQEGSGPGNLQDDGLTNRLWSDAPGAILDKVGNRVSAFAIEWSASAPYFAIDEAYNALIKGDSSGGQVTWTIGADHYLHSSDFFHTTSVGVALIPYPGVQSQAQGTIDQDFSWTNPSDGDLEFQYMRTLRAYVDANPGFTLGASMGAVELDGGHAEDALAKDRAARAVLVSGLNACGVAPVQSPLAVGLDMDAGLGFGDILIDLPEGGDLQTEWGLNAETPPAGVNAVQGIEITDITGSNVPVRSGFTTAIADSGTGAAPNRQARLRFSKDSGAWEPGTLVHLLPGWGMFYGVEFFTNDLWKGWPRESSEAYGGLGLLVPQGLGSFAIPVDPVAHLGARAWFDVNDETQFFQERTGAAASTPAGDGDPVGTVVVSGPAGGFFVAPSDSARPIRRRLVQSIDKVLADNNTRFTYKAAGAEVWYLDFDGVDDRLDYSAGALIPDSDSWALGMAVASTDLGANRHVVSQANGLPAGFGDFAIFQNVATNLGPFGSHWRTTWKEASPEIIDPPLVANMYSGQPDEQAMLFACAPGSAELIGRQRTTAGTQVPSTSGVNQVTFSFGQSAQVPMLGAYKGRVYGIFVSDVALSETQKRQASVWLGQRFGQIAPYW